MTDPHPLTADIPELIRKPASYQENRYVPRHPLLKAIQTTIDSVRDGSPLNPFISLIGPKFSGKTFTLEHLFHSSHSDADTANTTLIARLHVEESALQTLTCKRLLDAWQAPLLEQISQRPSWDKLKKILDVPLDTIDEREAALTLTTIGRELSGQSVFLVLVDLDDISLEQLESTQTILEDKLLEPVLKSNRAIVVMSAREEVMLWQRFEVRRRAQVLYVLPFTYKEIQTLLQKLKSNVSPLLVAWIYKFTGGSPHLSRCFFELFKWVKGQPDDPETTFATHAALFYEAIRLYRDNVCESLREHELLPIVDVISALRHFRLETFRWMLTDEKARPLMYKPLFEHYSLQKKRDIFFYDKMKALERTEAVEWDESSRAYLINQILRVVIDRCLLLGEREQRAYHQTRHMIVLDLYSQRIDEYPQQGTEYILEMLFHHASLFLEHGELSRFLGGLNQACNYGMSLDPDYINRLEKALQPPPEATLTVYNRRGVQTPRNAGGASDLELRDLLAVIGDTLPEKMYTSLSRALRMVVDNNSYPAFQTIDPSELLINLLLYQISDIKTRKINRTEDNATAVSVIQQVYGAYEKLISTSGRDKDPESGSGHHNRARGSGGAGHLSGSGKKPGSNASPPTARSKSGPLKQPPVPPEYPRDGSGRAHSPMAAKRRSSNQYE